jgi:hypothetical protein
MLRINSIGGFYWKNKLTKREEEDLEWRKMPPMPNGSVCPPGGLNNSGS